MSYNKAPSITAETINPKVKIISYEPCGQIARHAERLQQEIEENPGSLPFQEITYCNLGNPQALGQRPITFFREVLSLCDNPTLLDKDETPSLYSTCAIKRARMIMDSLPSKNTGGYTSSRGIKSLRQAVADGISARDGFPSDPDDIFLTDGASAAVNLMMQILIRSSEDAILCPLPEYPIYSASIILHGGTMVMSITNQEEIVEFCRKEGLVILADEVYQDNVYAENKKFNSFKKVARSLDYDENDLSIVSFHSSSMGLYGESGRRGGYMEISGFGTDVKEQIYKVASVTICPNIAGQILTSLVMDPPKLGDESFESFQAEKEKIHSSFWKRAKVCNLHFIRIDVASLDTGTKNTLEKAFQSMEGISCNKIEGALYFFPRLHLPSRAIKTAKAEGVSPDIFYAHRLLDATGIAVVPGSGFQQASGTTHIRCAILPDEEKIEAMIPRLRAFHEAFMKEFRR
ncbi:hypothetical protein PR202_gb22541 [Eleusine coracana subsp. coracana]|uniref:Aminotransferase class I/classII large domain-containing protein n=1 Tax=Eleusine coracana subsp. coracana TaxID=191504 RepID=A0AAV5FFX8_ELECO|nr:hypothetical protein PR202_gb22541 [Eleusine coracana subsp. coracana]